MKITGIQEGACLIFIFFSIIIKNRIQREADMKQNKNKLKQISVSVSIGLMMAMGASGAMAQAAAPQTSTPQILIPEFSAEQLKEARCDPNIWSELVQNYLNKRSYERQVQGQIQVIDQARAAPQPSTSSGSSCWDTALNQIGSIASTLDNIMSIFSGGLDINKLGNIIKQQVTNYACNQLTNFTGQIAYGVNSTVNGVYQDTVGKIGYNNGVINVGGRDVIQNPTGTSYGNGAISGAYNQGTSGIRGAGNAVGSAVGNTYTQGVGNVNNAVQQGVSSFK